MPLLNYTTEIPASKSIGEIMTILQQAGARAIMLENGVEKTVVAISFALTTSFGDVTFQLPANVNAVTLTINAQIRAETLAIQQRKQRVRRIPSRLFNDKEQAERIAWRIAKDWIEAQVALAAIGCAKLEQVMLPYARTADGRTFYEAITARGTLALPAPRSEPRDVTAGDAISV